MAIMSVLIETFGRQGSVKIFFPIPLYNINHRSVPTDMCLLITGLQSHYTNAYVLVPFGDA